jgi:exonuclease VII small subunit
MSEASNIPKEAKTVQDKLSELSELVTWFQRPSFKLEEAVEKFKQSEKLAQEIEVDLTKLKNDIKVIKKKFDSQE